ncbi:hypothetical protein C0992_010645 [Termitomyces sp. T32_za158]|nr:hypothetical protein C0992_010645 [Termitomyces sp. T32_za158]
MPGKQVRFAETHLLLTPPTPPPFLPFPSPSTPLTPLSSSNDIPSPSSYIAPPFSQPITPTQIHPLLQWTGTPVLNFDLRRSPATITSNLQRLLRETLSESATAPILKSLTIMIPGLPWTITVNASRKYVTVQDVLDELYYFFRKNISAEEFHALPTDQARRKVTLAYEQRYRRITSPREYEDEKRRGVTRVDFMMGHNNFAGLSPTTLGPECLLLYAT